MTAPGLLRGRPALAVLVALVLVAATVVLVVLVRDSNSGGTPTPRAVETSSGVPEDEHEGEHEGEHEDEHEEGEHEHDHVDTVDPDIDPADYVAFCAAFYEFAGAYSSAMETLNASGEAPAFLMAAATDFRAVAATTELSDEVRVGLEWFIDDVLRVPNDASAEEQLAWSTFLNSACPA